MAEQQQFSDNPDGQKAKVIAMYDVNGRERQREKTGVPQGQIRNEDTVDLSREELQRRSDKFC